MAAPCQAAAVEFGQKFRLLQNSVAECDGLFERRRRDVPDGGAGDHPMPHAADRVVEQHAHEAMIEPDRPASRRGDPGQGDPRQFEPALDPAPLILSLTLAAHDQARLDRLRNAHFPPERNFLAAHVTLFHHLPGPEHEATVATLSAECASLARFPVRVARLQSLGRGVALALESEPLTRLRARLGRRWADWLTAQDRQGFRPHVTIQNKVEPSAAKALLAELSAGFAPWTVEATGLSLWRYRGGPWEEAGSFPFAQDQLAGEPADGAG